MRKVYHGILLQAQEGILVWLIALHLGTPGGKQLPVLWLVCRTRRALVGNAIKHRGECIVCKADVIVFEPAPLVVAAGTALFAGCNATSGCKSALSFFRLL
jgi:hypothetical protein